MSSPAPTKIRVALDWTPNSNHIGFAVAAAEGYFADAGLDVEIISPHADAYKATPASRLSDGTAEFACVPSETVVSYATWPAAEDDDDDAARRRRPRIVAVAALLQTSASAVVTLKSSGLDRPGKLDGRTYLSYGARYEGRIVRELIRRDGGEGSFAEATPPMLEIWDRFLKGEGDATWIFLPHEGVLARRAGVELNAFDPAESVPYGYSPVLVARADWLDASPGAARAFLAAAARGYERAAARPDEAAAALVEHVSAAVSAGRMPPLEPPLDPEFVAESAREVSPHLLDAGGRWGRMDPGRWRDFLGFLDSSGLLTRKVQSRDPAGRADAATLDELRAPGGGGERVPPPRVEDLATNDYLPPPKE